MNVLLLGNGFDLHHKLPTKYINFLHTVDFIIKNSTSEFNNIGDIFGNSQLSSIDKEISESYVAYKDVYDSTELEQGVIDKFSKLKSNMWFSYFLSSISEDITWIDFERKVSEVIEGISMLLKHKETKMVLVDKCISNPTTKQIALKFTFFLEKGTKGYTVGARDVKEEFLENYPLGSKNYVIDTQKIINTLMNELYALSEALRCYLSTCIDKILPMISNKEAFTPWKESFKGIDKIVSFNYTNTCEKIYLKETIHLHGRVDDRIVLGINPDSADKVDTINTAFIQFKKYFQRVIYKTDIKYLEFIKEIKTPNQLPINNLFVIGHSLDVTDEDIIKELFELSKNIIILNYNESDESNHVTNLVNIYGKDKFDSLRLYNNLTFLPIDTNIKNIIDDNDELKFFLNNFL